MRHPTTTGPPADGGYPADSDLHQMSDDGGPVGPDPARWVDPDWRDPVDGRVATPPASHPPVDGRGPADDPAATDLLIISP